MAALGEDWRRGQCNIMGTGRAGSQKWCPRSDSRGRRNLRGLEPQKLRRKILPNGEASSVVWSAAEKSRKMRADKRKICQPGHPHPWQEQMMGVLLWREAEKHDGRHKEMRGQRHLIFKGVYTRVTACVSWWRWAGEGMNANEALPPRLVTYI